MGNRRLQNGQVVICILTGGTCRNTGSDQDPEDMEVHPMEEKVFVSAPLNCLRCLRVVPSCGSQTAVRRAIILNNEPICIHLLNTGTAGIAFRYICAIQFQRYRTLPCRFDCRVAAHLNVHIEKCHQLRFSPIRFNRNRILGHGTGNHSISKRPVFAGKSPVQDRQNSRIF